MISVKPFRLLQCAHQTINTRRNHVACAHGHFYKKNAVSPRIITRAKHKHVYDREKALSADKHELADHRSLGTSLSLFTVHSSSPGSPIFHPDGTHILQKLQSFLRAQYPLFGIQEVLTPTIYKKNLWQLSGHWENYQDDMFTVIGRGAHGMKDFNTQIGEDEEYGLKPMNCPGHCLLFQSQKRSYRDLPMRFADFSPLHRNELSGSLSGLTRLRRFHQDDGHIFCRPAQVGQEIEATLQLLKMVYNMFDLGTYELLLSTRPKTNFIGSIEEWDRAEAQLKVALEKSGSRYDISEGDGAFYGPKIDIILTDIYGKRHQTATIQLDFQLPQRFKLEYQSPAPEQEAQGVSTNDAELLAKLGMVTPVIIHRAILGSLERFMALLVERYQGHWPFWLSPRQMIILSVGDNQEVNDYASALARDLAMSDAQTKPRKIDSQTFTIDIDISNQSLAKKVLEANMKRYNIICVIGARNLESGTLDLSLSNKPNARATWDTIEKIKPGSQGTVQKGAANKYRNMAGVRLTRNQCLELMQSLCNSYL